MKKLLKSARGFTLIEMVITIALLAILTTMAASVMVPMTKVVRTSTELAEINRVYDTLSGEMTADLERAAAAITAGDGAFTVPTSSGSVAYTDVDGVIYKAVDGGEAQPMLDKAYYRNWRAAFSLAGDGGVYTLTLTLTNADGEEFPSREYKVRPLALNQY